MEIIDIVKPSTVSFWRHKTIRCVVAANNMKWPKNTVMDMVDAATARDKAFDDLNKAMRAAASTQNRSFVPAYTVEDVFG